MLILRRPQKSPSARSAARADGHRPCREAWRPDERRALAELAWARPGRAVQGAPVPDHLGQVGCRLGLAGRAFLGRIAAVAQIGIRMISW